MVTEIYRVWDGLASIEVIAESGDGYVAATVGPRGELRALVLDPRIYRMPDARVLAETVLDTITTASVLARQQAFRAVASLLSRDATAENTDVAFDPVLHHLAQKVRNGVGA